MAQAATKKQLEDKAKVLAEFGEHISEGQLRYLRAAHLDMLESRPMGIGFTNACDSSRVVDGFTSAGCFNVGRGNKSVIAALAGGLEGHDLGGGGLLSPAKVNFAAKLADICPADLNRVLPAGSGAEAIEGALKLAWGATGRPRIISMLKAYHGHSGYSLSINGKDYYKELFLPLSPDVDFARFGDIADIRRLASKDTAAIILEPIQGEGGIHVADDFYLNGLRQVCDELGILLIFDEIQTGFGRTGKLWASEHSGVVPDIMVVAKSIGGGVFPNAAVIYRDIPALSDFVDRNPQFHATSSGFSELGCIVSSRVVDYICENRLWENAEAMGARFRRGLEELSHKLPGVIKEIRGRGLMVGIEYKYEFMGALMADCLAKQNIFAAYSGNAPQVMRFMMPITITEHEVDIVLAKIKLAMKTMRRYLMLLLPLTKIPKAVSILDNIKVQIAFFNWLRKFERG